MGKLNLNLKPQVKNIITTLVVAITTMLVGCFGDKESLEISSLSCQTSHATTVHDSKNLKAIQIHVERSKTTGNSTIFTLSKNDGIRIQTLTKESKRFKVSYKNQAVIAKDPQGKILDLTPAHKVDRYMVTVVEIPYYILESISIIQTVKQNNPQTGSVVFYPVKEKANGYKHPLNAIEGILAPGSYLPSDVNNYLLSNLSAGSILIPDISKNFINFSEVRNVSDVCP